MKLATSGGIGEFAAEYSHYLFDVMGDEDFEAPLLQILRNLVRWDETGRDPDQLLDLLQDVRQILSRTL